MKQPLPDSAEIRIVTMAAARLHGVRAGALTVLAAMIALCLAGAASAEPAMLTLQTPHDRFEAAAAQILSVEVRTTGDFPEVLVTLNPALQPGLTAFSQRHVGEVILVRVCGLVVSAPSLRAPIRTTEFAISAAELPDARSLAARLAAKDCQAGIS